MTFFHGIFRESHRVTVKLPLHMGLRLNIGVLIDGIVDQQLMRGFEKPFDMQDFVRVSFLPMRLFELNCRNITYYLPAFSTFPSKYVA